MNSELIPQAISQNEFIVDLKRITKDLYAPEVVYELKTASPTVEEVVETDVSGEATTHYKINYKENKYKVTIALSPNPLIGPLVTTVVSVEKIDPSTHTFFTSY